MEDPVVCLGSVMEIFEARTIFCCLPLGKGFALISLNFDGHNSYPRKNSSIFGVWGSTWS